MTLAKSGYITIEELDPKQIPSDERYRKGPVACIECIQEIPCNPCEKACRQGAIVIGEPLIRLPVLLEDKCSGCGLCVAKCPGLAIFIVDKTYSETEASVSFPYEYTPLPTEEEEVDAVNRAGKEVCKATVVKVLNPSAFDKTPVVTLAIPKQFADEVRSMKRK